MDACTEGEGMLARRGKGCLHGGGTDACTEGERMLARRGNRCLHGGGTDACTEGEGMLARTESEGRETRIRRIWLSFQ